MATLIFVILPVAFILLKYHTGKTILGCLTKNPAREPVEQDKHILNKQTNGHKETKKNRQNPKEERIDMVEHAPIPTSRDKRIKISKIRNEIESNLRQKREPHMKLNSIMSKDIQTLSQRKKYFKPLTA